MKYQVLGPVTALLDERRLDFQQKCQHLLAVLVLEHGQPVSRQRLAEILWDEPDPLGRDTRLTRIVSDLRQRLRSAVPGSPDPIPTTGNAYKLVMRPEESDLDRFRGKATKAKTLDGDAAIQMMEEALGEWTEGHGLYGRPLAGLGGSWADSNREKLRLEHRDAHLFRLERIAQNGGYEQVAGECRMLDDNADALLDEAFVATWMFTAYRVGGPETPLSVFRRAQERSERCLERSVSRQLTDLARRIEDHDPELNGHRALAIAPPSVSPTGSAHPLTSGTGPTEETTTMSEENDRPIFHNVDSTIGAQAKDFNEKVTINLGVAPKKEESERSERPQDDTDGTTS